VLSHEQAEQLQVDASATDDGQIAPVSMCLGTATPLTKPTA
jgi:hypothetical protein